MILKATHLPFVALIWGYESLGSLSHKDLAPKMSPLDGRPFSASQIDIGRDRGRVAPSSRPTTALIPANLLALPSRADTSKQAVISTAESNAELLSLVQRLSTQVDALTSMVAGQQKD